VKAALHLSGQPRTLCSLQRKCALNARLQLTDDESGLNANLRRANNAIAAAMFDFDGTLFRGRSGLLLVQTALARRRLGAGVYASLLGRALLYLAGRRNEYTTIGTVALALRGWPEKEARALGRCIASRMGDSRVNPEASRILAAHARLGHRLVIVSASAPYVVEPMARRLGVGDLLCTRLECAAGRLTGRVIHPTCWGKGKLEAVCAFAERESIDLSRSFYYCDGLEDLPVLEAVGHPHPFNPDRALRRVAARRGWQSGSALLAIGD
jgi:putative phosphoserine phosphatase / 1-acylglycerol-3-phosphate O-acyltransferase